jgi:hypothetical protein
MRTAAAVTNPKAQIPNPESQRFVLIRGCWCLIADSSWDWDLGFEI